MHPLPGTKGGERLESDTSRSISHRCSNSVCLQKAVYAIKAKDYLGMGGVDPTLRFDFFYDVEFSLRVCMR